MKQSKRYLLLLLVTVAFGLTSCIDNTDNPVVPVPTNPETPEQQAFWAPFDSWQTDSCTVGDDFYMHMIGTWWKNPMDIYPDGVVDYAGELNNGRVSAIITSNPNLLKLRDEIIASEQMSEAELEQMVTAKVEELWAGAVTREEALAALGRAWAEGYTLMFEPVLNLVNGKPVWQVELKVPSYITQEQIAPKIQELWHLLAPRKSTRLKARGAQDAEADLDIIVKAMNIGVDHMEVTEDAAELFLNTMNDEWSTVEDIKSAIQMSVFLLDGLLVSDECLEGYNQYLATQLAAHGVTNEVVLMRGHINDYLLGYMVNLYLLDDYNRRYITPQVRQQYKDWCQQFSSAMRQRLETNTWLSDATRQEAINKLDNIIYYVGGIDEIPDCVIPTLTGKSLIDDVRQLRKARFDGYCWAASRTRSKIAMLLNNLRLISDATIDNASYLPYLNVVCINPSNLCEPYVDKDYDESLQWAFLGTTIGHELTHGFDNTGSKYDLWGNQTNWWTAADADKFQILCDQLTEHYNALQLMPWADPTLYGDGAKTLGENIADLGGCCLALQILLDKHPGASEAEKKALARRFFQGWAIQWSKSYGLDFVTEMKEGDNHSQARERTNGVVRNVNEWYDAYDIHSGTLYLQPSKRVKIW